MLLKLFSRMELIYIYIYFLLLIGFFRLIFVKHGKELNNVILLEIFFVPYLMVQAICMVKRRVTETFKNLEMMRSSVMYVFCSLIRLNANQTKFDYSNLNRPMNHSVDIIITVDDKVFLI